MAQERLQKIIAAAGIASRRHAEELITQGRVTVNGQVVATLGSKADPGSDHIKVDGKAIHVADRQVYILLHKPKGYVTTVSDPEGRPTVMELVKSKARVFPVGRLDWNTEGLLLLTNDGALTAKLTHASTHVPKTYLVKVAGHPSRDDIQKLREGVMIGGEGDPVPGKLHRVRTAPARIREVREADNPWYEVTLIEGRNRQIRRMFEAVGHHVEKIKRVRYGPLELDVPPGAMRELRPHEVAQLQRYVSDPAAAAREQAGFAREATPPRAAGLPPARKFDKAKNFRFRKSPPFRREERAPKGWGTRREFGGRREPGGERRPFRQEDGEGRRGGITRYDAEGKALPFEPRPRKEFGERGPKRFDQRPFGRRDAARPAGEDAGAPFRRGPRREFGKGPRGPKKFGRPFGARDAARPAGERPALRGGPKRFGGKKFGAPKRSFGGSKFGAPKRSFGGPREERRHEGGGERRGGAKRFSGRFRRDKRDGR